MIDGPSLAAYAAKELLKLLLGVAAIGIILGVVLTALLMGVFEF